LHCTQRTPVEMPAVAKNCAANSESQSAREELA
jgi:hypothetical protein